MNIKYCFVVLWAVLLMSCGGSEPVTPVGILRFDTIETSYRTMSPSARDSALTQYAPEIGFLQALYEVPTPDSVLTLVSASSAAEVFGPDIRSRLTDLSPVELHLGALRQRLPKVFPSLKMPGRISGIILPYRQSVVLSDSLLLVGLNHYLGNDYAGYATFDTYTRAQKELSRIPYHVAEAIVGSTYPYKNDDAAIVLSRLLYEGAVVEALSQLFPDDAPADVMGYTPEQMESLTANESALWQRIINGNMLYSVDPMLAVRLTEPASATSIISPDAPPRAGRYLGWRIVRAYLDSHPEATLDEILSPDFYHSAQSLKEANYSPSSQ